ncbi:hypothetical protein NMY22_g10646 [Coprinellus aureogranulatus]|nr:hypothetical protein NMY22_g10646 [Coprinellus aureogranulatus]
MPPAITHVPHLNYLDLHGEHVPYGLASSLDLPSLTTLSIFSSVILITATDRTCTTVLEWTMKFGPQLTAFTFNYGVLSIANSFRVFQALPNVLELDITGPFNGVMVRPSGDSTANMEPQSRQYARFDDVVEIGRLAPMVQSSDGLANAFCCPSLRILRCAFLTGATENEARSTEEALVELISARRAGPGDLGKSVAPIEEVHIRLREPRISIQGPRLRDSLSKRGVNMAGIILDVTSQENTQS